jgi:hypothetical protein
MCLAFLQGFLVTMFPRRRGNRTSLKLRLPWFVWWDFVCAQEKSCATSSPSSFSFSLFLSKEGQCCLVYLIYWTYHLWNWKKVKKIKRLLWIYWFFHWLVYSHCYWDTYGVNNRDWFCCILMEFLNLVEEFVGFWW